MTIVSIKELIEAGVHFGHRASRWHPSMSSYIYGKHNLIHIVDLRQTIRGIIGGSHFLGRLTEAGHEVVFVGTKPQARETVRAHAERCGMHFVTNRWLGGTLTNFNTIRSRLKRLEELETWESDGSMRLRSKKEISSLRRERRKIHRNLEGIRHMARQPGALVVVDIRRDAIAVAEANLLGIPVIAIVDTDCNPTHVDFVIPGNDDAYRSIDLILTRLSDAIMAGRDKLLAHQAAEEKKRLEEEEETRRKAASRAAGSPPDKDGGKREPVTSPPSDGPTSPEKDTTSKATPGSSPDS